MKTASRGRKNPLFQMYFQKQAGSVFVSKRLQFCRLTDVVCNGAVYCSLLTRNMTSSPNKEQHMDARFGRDGEGNRMRK